MSPRRLVHYERKRRSLHRDSDLKFSKENIFLVENGFATDGPEGDNQKKKFLPRQK